MTQPEQTYAYEVAEMVRCAGPDVAARAHEARRDRDGADYGAATLLLDAVRLPDTAEMRHTADVAEMLRGGHHNAALSMHAAYVTAEFEHEDLTGIAPEALTLDVWLAGLLLSADAWRRTEGLPACDCDADAGRACRYV
jgi:hypothetical protein